VVVYSQRAREAFGDVPIVIGGIEASLRRIAHYDYWSDQVRRSILVDSHADLLVYGNGERAIVEIAHRLAARTPIASIRDVRGTGFMLRTWPDGMVELDSTTVDRPGPVAPPSDPYAMVEATPGAACADGATPAPLVTLRPRPPKVPREQQAIRLPAFEAVRADPVLYAHASRVLHHEANPGNARALVQRHGDRDVWLNPPPIPLTTAEMDALYELPYQRVPHPGYGGAKLPAYEMIRFSVTILRGCFGGCSFCSITEHEGRIIQNRSEASILREIEAVRDRTPGFHGIISDLGGPTANMWRLACKDREIEAACRKPSCVFPDICENLGTDHGPLIALYRKARPAGREEDPDRQRPALRPRGAVAGLREGAGPAPHRRLPEDRSRAHRGRSPRAHDEAGHRDLRPVQGAVRSRQRRGRQGAVPDPVLHRRPPRHDRRGHAEPRGVAQGQRLPPRPGPGLLAVADGDRDRDVPHRLQPAALAQGPGAGGHGQARPSAAVCTRRSSATTTRRTGRCCAPPSSAWAARS
jgi:hypothetical protein